MTITVPAVLRGVDRVEFRRGFVAMMPLWLGVVPFAVAYALLARTGGLSSLETIALAVFVFAGSAQLAFVNLTGDHAGAIAIVGTVLVLNLRHILYGLSLNELMPAKTEPGRPVLAYFLTDESYGLTVREFRGGRGSPAFFFGASVSVFVSFTVATISGMIAGSFIPDTERLGLDVVFPLSFLALLLPLLRKRLDIAIALFAAGLALAISSFASGGVTILLATTIAATTGALLRERRLRMS